MLVDLMLLKLSRNFNTVYLQHIYTTHLQRRRRCGFNGHIPCVL